MDGEYRLDIAEELAAAETVLQIDRDQSCLPVVAVDDIRLEADDRQCGKGSLGEESELLQVVEPVAVGLRAAEIAFVVDEIERDAVLDILHDPDVSVLSVVIHVEMIHILKLVADLFLDAHIFRDHDPDVKILLVKTFRQSAGNVSKASGLDKRNCF